MSDDLDTVLGLAGLGAACFCYAERPQDKERLEVAADRLAARLTRYEEALREIADSETTRRGYWPMNHWACSFARAALADEETEA